MNEVPEIKPPGIDPPQTIDNPSIVDRAKNSPEWQRGLEKTADMENKAGDTPVEKEVLDTVIALNLMGFETRASCGGHDKIRNQKQNNEMIKRGKNLYKPVKVGGRQVMRKVSINDEAMPSDPYVALERREGEAKRLRELLQEFYEGRFVRDKRAQIMLLGRKGVLGLKVGAALPDSQDLQFIEENLGTLQEEFKDFSEFLTKKLAEEGKVTI